MSPGFATQLPRAMYFGEAQVKRNAWFDGYPTATDVSEVARSVRHIANNSPHDFAACSRDNNRSASYGSVTWAS